MKFRLGREFWVNTGVCCASILFCLTAIELTARFIIHTKYPSLEEDLLRTQDVIRRSFAQEPLFKPHPYLSYVPSDTEIMEDGCIIAGEKFSLNKSLDTLRIACLGGSTTMRAYPIHLKIALEQCFPDKKIEVMDWGCSNWTIMESMINYMNRARLFRPDAVIVHEGVNDVAPRLRKSFRFDYSHYRKAYTFEKYAWYDTIFYQSWMATWLRFRTGRNIANLTYASVQPYPADENHNYLEPPESTALAYRECLDAIVKIAKSDGAAPIFAGMIYNATFDALAEQVPVIEQHNAIARDYAHKENVLYADMQRHFGIRQELFTDQVHLVGIGNQIKGFLLASAVAMVKEGTPCVWATGQDSNKSGNFTEPENRRITIHWNSFHHDIQYVKIFVRVNGDKEKLLIKKPGTYLDSFNWDSGRADVEPEFRNGPAFGKTYEFAIYTEGAQGPYPPLLMVKAVTSDK